MRSYQELQQISEKYKRATSEKNSIIEAGEIRIIRFPLLSQFPRLNHCFTTRTGGVSEGCCDSLNLSFGRESNVENVQENFRRLMDAYGEDPNRCVFLNQNHTVRIQTVHQPDVEFYGPWIFDLEEIDGSVTKETDITLFTYYGDCVPVYVYDSGNHIIGLVHSGWRGTVDGAGRELVLEMIRIFGSSPENLYCVIGPSIGPECFQVDFDVAEEFRNAFMGRGNVVYEDRVPNKYRVDLWEANRIHLLSTGVPNENIHISGLCTCCDEKMFFSHRRDLGRTGSMAALMTLK